MEELCVSNEITEGWKLSVTGEKCETILRSFQNKFT